MSSSSNGLRLATFAGLGLAALVWGYVAVGPPGLLPRAATAGLPMPARSTNAQGAVSARIDAAEWEAACEAAGLPAFPDPTGLEFEPLKRLVEASQRWAATGDGDELGRMGEVAMALELHGPAIDYFAAAREFGSQTETWAYFLGAECQLIGASQAAIAALERARQQNQSYGTTSLRLGALHFELGDLQQADASYALAAKRDPAPAAGLVGRGRVALAQREFEAALLHLDAALRTTPRDFLAHRLRSQSLAGLGRLEEASAAAKLSNELTPYRGWLTFDPRLGDALKRAATQHSLETALSVAIGQGNMPAALAAGEELLKRLPNSPGVLSVLSRILANSGDLPRALQLAQRAVDLEPENMQALRALADIATGAGEFDRASRAIQAMVTLAPRDAMAHQSLGRLYFKQGRLPESIAELRRAIQLEPRSAQHRLMLVDVLRRGERFLDAEIELEGVLAIEPSNAEAQAALQALRAR